MSTINHKWYAVNVYSGFEKKVADHIQEQSIKKGLSEHISQISVPSEKVSKVNRGQKTLVDQAVMPGYVLVKMNMIDDTWHLVKSSPKVTGFLGNKNTAYPLSDLEVERMIGKTEEQTSKQETVVAYMLGETVKVSDGPFASFNGIVENIDQNHNRLTVSVSIFGRATPVDLDFSQVEKIVT